MTAITFDTMKFVHRLKDSGIPEQQAEAISAAFRDATGEAKLTTKGDLREMEHRINGELKLLERATKGDLREMEHRINGELKLLKWMLTALLAANMAVLIKFFSA